jgi:hypothetical protein
VGSVTTLLLAKTKESERWIPHQNSKEHTKRLRERVGREMEKGTKESEAETKESERMSVIFKEVQFVVFFAIFRNIPVEGIMIYMGPRIV